MLSQRTNTRQCPHARFSPIGAQQSGRDAIDEEKRRYREAAKKLKLKRKGRTAALGDGLDDFTAGLTTANMSDSEADSGATFIQQQLVQLAFLCVISLAFRCAS